MVGLLLDYRIPLSQAISWASAGSPNADLRQFGAQLAAGVEGGCSLSSLLESRRSMAGTLAMMVQWGEHVDALPSALATAADYFEDRARLRIACLRVAVPPVVFVLVATVGVLLFSVVLSAFWLSVYGF
jgi:type II secretory pathway component PulF